MMDRKDILYIAARAAVEAGKKILEIYNDPSSDFGIERKADNSPLTVADKASHAVIRSFLSSTPYPVLSEEGRLADYAERREWDALWVVDPLDGTKEFIKRNGEFTVNIALMVDNRPAMSVVYVPYLQKMYFCDRALGAFVKEEVTDSNANYDMEAIFKDAKRLPLVTQANKPIRIAVSRSHNTPATFEFIEILKRQGQCFGFVSKRLNLIGRLH